MDVGTLLAIVTFILYAGIARWINHAGDHRVQVAREARRRQRLHDKKRKAVTRTHPDRVIHDAARLDRESRALRAELAGLRASGGRDPVTGRVLAAPLEYISDNLAVHLADDEGR